jgi:hypothetical protein
VLHTVLFSPRAAGPSTHSRKARPTLGQSNSDEDEKLDCNSQSSHNLSDGRSETHTILDDEGSERPVSPTASDGADLRRSIHRLELPADLPPVVVTESRLGPNTIRLQAAEPPEVFQLAMANLLANPTFTYIDPAGSEPPKRERGDNETSLGGSEG